jgi:enoyl-CoA hydratase
VAIAFHSAFVSHNWQLNAYFTLDSLPQAHLIRLTGDEPTNTLTRERVTSLTSAILDLRSNPKPVILTGNDRYFSAGADIRDVAALTAASAYEFAAMGQALMNAVAEYPAPTYAAISGFCMGGGLDLALACSHRIAAPHSIFGHRGAALGIVTGWGGTQRLPELIGKARALQMFLCAEKVSASQALEIGLINTIAPDPVGAALKKADEFALSGT